MATSVVTPPPEQQLDPQLQKLADDMARDAGGAPPAAPVPMEVKLETGQVFKGTPEEIIDSMSKSVESGSRTISEQKRALETAHQTAPRPLPTSDTGLKPEDYWRLADQDPVKATMTAISSATGIPVEQVPQALRSAVEAAGEHRQSNQIMQFYAKAPGYVATPENGNLMSERMRATSREPTSDNLKLTYLELKEEGVIQPAAKNNDPSPERLRPAPSLGGTTGGGGDAVASLEQAIMNEPMDKVEALMRRAGLR